MAEKTPHQNITFPLPDSDVTDTGHGYVALPASGSGPGVVVIQEWWGLTDHIKDVADRLAEQGFVALAPDLYGGWISHDGEEAGGMKSKLPAQEGARQLAGATDFLLGHEKVTSSTVGAIGFCMGGGFVLSLAAQQGEKISAAVPFYGVGQAVPEVYTGVKVAVQSHYADQDQMYPPEKAHQQEQQIREESGAQVEFFYYDAERAKLAWGSSFLPCGIAYRNCANELIACLIVDKGVRDSAGL